MCKPNPDPFASPEGFRLPLDSGQIEAAKEALRDNKGAQWSVCFAIGIQVGGNAELRDNLVRLLLEVDLPTSTISDMFGLSGREIWEIAALEPISLSPCLDCGTLLCVRDRRDLVRLNRALAAVSSARPGDSRNTNLLCGSCTELRLHLHNQEQRLRRLARQARVTQLRKMPFAEYSQQPEWQARRTLALSRAGYRCQMCKRCDMRLNVHHNTYERYGDESISDLVVLCSPCHELFHGTVSDAS